jgi:hypothetical protein
MSCTYDNRISIARAKTINVVDARSVTLHGMGVFGTDELLGAIEARGISQVEMARVLRLPSSRISEMYAGKRQVKLDEAKKLVEAFGLDDQPSTPPISEQTARILILHVANRLAAAVTDELLQELALDFQAFSRFARAHLPAPSPEATLGFLAGRQSDRAPLKAD